MKAAAFELLHPEGLSQALQVLGSSVGYTKLLGGSQSLGPMLNLRLAQPDALVSISRLPELGGFTSNDGSLMLGAGITHAALEDGLVPDVTLGLMPFVASNIAYRAIRNRGTLGGSLAHADPAADWVSTMMLVGATVLLAAPAADGSITRREVAAKVFMQGPFTTMLGDHEIITAVRIPNFTASARWGYYKYCRKIGEFAEAIGAALVDPERGISRLVIGATDGVPLVIDDASEIFRSASPAQLSSLLAEAGMGDDPYFVKMHQTAALRAITMLKQSRLETDR
jgi:carbon-monoxide dehydrogenase medium subunit